MTSTSSSFDTTTGILTNSKGGGGESDYAYDYQNRILTTTVYSGAATLTGSNTYDRYRLVKSTDYYGRATSYTYDLLDRPLSTMLQLRPCGATITTQTRYNAQGLVCAVIDGNGNRTDYKYDARNRRVKTIAAAGTRESASTTLTYDANSNVLVRTDERGNNWVNTYTARDHVATSADSLGDTTSYVYNPDGTVASTTNANGNPTNYTYLSCCPRVLTQVNPTALPRCLATTTTAT